MRYLHVKNIEKYQPRYTDRKLHFCKLYFSMINTDAEFMLLDEIDKWRFVAFIMIELDSKKYVPLDEKFLILKGFDVTKKPISLTLSALRNFVSECESCVRILSDKDATPVLEGHDSRLSEDKISEDKISEAKRREVKTESSLTLARNEKLKCQNNGCQNVATITIKGARPVCLDHYKP